MVLPASLILHLHHTPEGHTPWPLPRLGSVWCTAPCWRTFWSPPWWLDCDWPLPLSPPSVCQQAADLFGQHHHKMTHQDDRDTKTSRDTPRWQGHQRPARTHHKVKDGHKPDWVMASSRGLFILASTSSQIFSSSSLEQSKDQKG